MGPRTLRSLLALGDTPMSHRRCPRSAVRALPSSMPRRRRRWKLYRPFLERLEDRTLLSLDLTSFAQHFHDELGTLQTTIGTALDGASQIPFLNKKLGDDGSSQVFTSALLSNLQTAIAGVTDVSQLQSVIFNVIGPSGTGPHVLGDTDQDGTVDQNDVIVTGDKSGFEVETRLHQGVTNATTGFNLNLGLPGIPFKVMSQGTVNLQINFDYELAVKFNPNNSDPFSVDASKVLKDTKHQMSLTVMASLPTM